MHKQGSRTNGPQGIWGNRGSGCQHVLALGQMGLRTVGTKGPFEALGHMAYMGFSTFGLWTTDTMHIYYDIGYYFVPQCTHYGCLYL